MTEVGDCYTLTGRKRDTALSFGIENLEHENGMNRRLEKLTTVFDVNATDKAFKAWVAFETCICPLRNIRKQTHRQASTFSNANLSEIAQILVGKL